MEIKFTNELRNAIEEARKQINQRKPSLTDESSSFCEDEVLYEIDKKAIYGAVLPNRNKRYSRWEIYRILTLIDNLYSTYMQQTSFALRDLACAIYDLQQHDTLWNCFEGYLINKTYANNRVSNLFINQYGVKTDGQSGQKAISLITKFAYFITDLQFPIYDSLVRMMLPLVWQKAGYTPLLKPQKTLKDIVPYITAIDNLINNLFGNVNRADYYDAVDYILWRVGKIYNIDPKSKSTHPSNPALLLKKTEYCDYRKAVNATPTGRGTISIFKGRATDPLLHICADIASSLRLIL